MRIHQLNIQYAPEEDRLIFKLNTHEGDEFCFFFTRRFVKILMPLMEEYLKSVQTETTTSEQKESISQFEHEHALSQTEFQKPYQKKSKDENIVEDTPAETLPKPEEEIEKPPILVHGFKLYPLEQTNYLLSLHSKEGTGIEITIDKSILHSFYHLLEEGIKVAEWDLYPGFQEIGIPSGEKPH